MNNVHYSSKTPEWETPQWLFDDLNKEFALNVDVCATSQNRKCADYFGVADDGLSMDWKGLRCWMNPPYGRQIGRWVEKAAEGGAEIVVTLLPARTDTRWFHDHIYGKAEIRFLKGRLKFSGHKWNAPFPNMVVIFRGNKKFNPPPFTENQ